MLDDATQQLTPDEMEFAKRVGMTPERYKEMKGVRNIDDWVAAQQRLAASGEVASNV